MGKKQWILPVAATPALLLPLLLLFLAPAGPDPAISAEPILPAPPRPRPAEPGFERRPRTTSSIAGKAREEPDPRLAAALGFTAAVQARLQDARGTPLAGLPVLVVPRATWRWLSADPDRPGRYLANLAAAPTFRAPLADGRGRARIDHLPAAAELVLVSGGGPWLAGATPSFRGGTRERPATVTLTLHRGSTLSVRARGAEETPLPLLRVAVTPPPRSGVPARTFSPPGGRAAAVITCTGLPAGLVCRIAATALAEEGPTRLTRSATPVAGRPREVILELPQ